MHQIFSFLFLLAVCAESQNQVIFPLLHHDYVARRRLTEHPSLRGMASPDQTQVDPLYQGRGTHYVDLWLGCPNPQRQTVAVDTSSSLTAFQCNNCPPSEFDKNKCTLNSGSYRHVDPKYDTTQSECFRFVRCNNTNALFGVCEGIEIPEEFKDFDQTYYKEHYSDQYYKINASYADGSYWIGHVAQDQVYSGGLHEAPNEIETAFSPFYFGCQEDVEGLATLALSDGVMGMDRSKASYWQQWVASQEEKEKKDSHIFHQEVHPSSQFSLCFVKRPGEDKNLQGAGAGAMVLGGTEPRLNKHPMVYAQMLRDDQNYVVWIERIYVRKDGGKNVTAVGDNVQVAAVKKHAAELNKGKVILDSGSTGFLFSADLEMPFRNAWVKAMHREYDPDERPYTAKEMDELPTILIQFSARDQSKSVNPNQAGLAGRDKLDPDNPHSVVVALSPEHYMSYNPKHEMHGSQLVFGAEEGEPQILGSSFFAGHNIHFDVKNERIGFAESDCNMWVLGNANFNHTPHEGDEPPSQPPTQMQTEDESGEEANLDDGWACGSVSCGTALGLFLSLGMVLTCFALYRCRRAQPEASDVVITETIDIRDVSRKRLPDFQDYDSSEELSSDEAEDDDDSSDEEASYEMSTLPRVT